MKRGGRARAERAGGSGSAGRVIAGSARGTRLVAPGEGTRPLGDRVKQSLFAILEPALQARPFFDLYAGSGAAGIEALSRGASSAVFVESNRGAAHAIARNLKATGFDHERATVVEESVTTWLIAASKRGRTPDGPAAVAFLDPPYEQPVYLDWTLEGIAEEGPGGVLAADGIVVAKHFWKSPPVENRLLRSVRVERFGETTLTFYRWSAPGEGEEVG